MNSVQMSMKRPIQLAENFNSTDSSKLLRKQKIQIVIFSFFILEYGGGCENEFMELANKIMRYSDATIVTVVTAQTKHIKWLQNFLAICFFKKPDTNGIYRISSNNVKKKLGKAHYVHYKNFSDLADHLNEGNVIYVKNEIVELFIMKLLKRKINNPFIIKVATPIFYPITGSLSDKIHNLIYTSKFYKWLIQDAASIKVNSMYDKQYIKSKFGMGNVNVIHNEFKVSKGRQIKNNDHRLRILFVGRIAKPKGIDNLINIIESLHESSDSNQYYFKIAGSGDEGLESKLTGLSKKYVDVDYLGHQGSNTIAKLYDWTDVTIIPSFYETLNRVAAETAVAGKIAICTDIPGPREVIDNNKTGYLLSNNSSAFISKLKELARVKSKSKDLFYEVGLKAQQKIIDEFSASKVYRDYYEAFLECSSVSVSKRA